jgi:uncharacterized FlgJ-related protein
MGGVCLSDKCDLAYSVAWKGVKKISRHVQDTAELNLYVIHRKLAYSQFRMELIHHARQSRHYDQIPQEDMQRNNTPGRGGRSPSTGAATSVRHKQ